jgi:hypothetical protein
VSRAAEALRQALDQIAVDSAALEADLRRLTTAGQRVKAALLALDEDPDQPSNAELEEFRPAPPAEPTAPTEGQPTGFPCPICFAVFRTEHGMRMHRGKKHRNEIPAALADLPERADIKDRKPAPKATAARPDLVLACSECGAEFAPSNFAAMIRHCRLEHSRRPTPGERSPVNTLVGAA